MMKRSLILGACQGAGIFGVLFLGILLAYAADILTVDKDGTIRLRVSDQGKVTLNASTTTEGDLRFSTRSSDPTAPLSGDLWYNNTAKEIKYADGGITKPVAAMTNGTLTLYVNGAQADDAGDGLTSGTAKKFIQSAVNLVPPVVNHAVTINVAAGTYRDTGATIGSSTYNVYVGNKVVTGAGSITFVGDEATPSNVRVTGSDSGADTTPVRTAGFFISHVRNVAIKGFLCNYFTLAGIRYSEYASGSPANCICSNNTSSGISYDVFSRGWPNTCTMNNNAYGLIVNAGSSVNPTSCTASNNSQDGFRIQYQSDSYINSCTANSNYLNGVVVSHSSGVNIVNSSLSLNGTTGSGWGYAAYFGLNAAGSMSNCSSPGGNNQSGGLRAETGSRVDYTVPLPNANNATASASSEVW